MCLKCLNNKQDRPWLKLSLYDSPKSCTKRGLHAPDSLSPLFIKWWMNVIRRTNSGLKGENFNDYPHPCTLVPLLQCKRVIWFYTCAKQQRLYPMCTHAQNGLNAYMRCTCPSSSGVYLYSLYFGTDLVPFGRFSDSISIINNISLISLLTPDTLLFLSWT